MARPLATARHAASLTALAIALVLAPGAEAGDVRLGHAIGGVCPDCDFSGRDLSGASVIGVLPRSNFSNAILADARIGGNFASATFARADLTGAAVQSANFVNADFSGAKLDGARVGGSNFFAVDLTGATLRDVRASWTNFSGSNFLGAKLDGAVLEAVNASRSEFTRAELAGAVLANADLTGARFEDASLRDADLAGADATDAAFPGADLTGATLDDLILSGADLRGAIGLTPGALVAACGDERTKLPEGLSVSACPASWLLADSAWSPSYRLSRLDARRNADASWTVSFAAPPAPRSMELLLNEFGASGRASSRLGEARRAIGTAYAEAHAELDLEVREAILGASTALADVDAGEVVSSDADVLAVIDSLDRAQADIDSAAVREALSRARASLETMLTELSDVRAEIRSARPETVAESIEHERAKRYARLDRELAARQRRLDREIEARLRTLEAECERELFRLESAHARLVARLAAAAREERAGIEREIAATGDQGARTAADCQAGERALDLERENRLGAIRDEIGAEQARIQADLAELVRQLDLLDVQPE